MASKIHTRRNHGIITRQEDYWKKNVFRIRILRQLSYAYYAYEIIFLVFFLSHSLGIEITNTFINSGSSLENFNLLQTRK